jgi:hypothetical protein
VVAAGIIDAATNVIGAGTMAATGAGITDVIEVAAIGAAATAAIAAAVTGAVTMAAIGFNKNG